ncbi:17657_t:CDS:2, partial [Cetraspora pellucida]
MWLTTQFWNLKLPTASKDTLFFDPDTHPICADFIIERWIYYNGGCPNSLEEYMMLVKESPFGSIISPQKFRHNFVYDSREIFRLSNHMIGILLASLLVNYLEGILLKYPILRTLIKLSKLHTNFGFTDKIVKTADQGLFYTPLDHSKLVQEALDLMKQGKIPIITCPPGGGKSTHFAAQFQAQFKCSVLSQPRRLLVTNHPSTWPKLYSGCTDEFDDNGPNISTHGYLLAINKKFETKDFVIGIDEVHEMDEDSLILMERYKGHIYCLSVTPIPIPNGVEVKLKKTCNPYSVTELPTPTHHHLESNVFHYLNMFPNHKTLVIHLSYSVCVKLHDTLRNNDVEVIFATSVVEAGITIPNINLVIDSGLSIGKFNGVYVTRYSSRASAIQRTGRTGRTNDGREEETMMMIDDSDDSRRGR